MSLETIHPGVWIFLLLASVAIIWFLGKSTLNEERGKAIDQVEKKAGCVVILLFVGLVAAAVIMLLKETFEPF